jgi:squalene-hopene/tetraprenyl-beta-curcumene cyclase
MLVSLSLFTPPAPANPVTPEQARKAIERSLPFVEKEGIAWMNGRGCVSCHQVSSMVWSMNEATRQGFTVDAKKLKQWNEWSLNSAFSGNMYYKVSEPSFKKLRQAKLTEDDLAKLQPLKDREHLTEKAFLQELQKVAPADMFAKHKETILKAVQPGVGGGAQDGPSSLYNAMLYTGAVGAAKSPDQALRALLEGLRWTQQQDGLWKASGQFQGLKRPKTEANEVNTMWILLALSYVDSLPEALVQARLRAEEAIKKTKPGVSTESLMLHMLLAHKANDTTRSRELQAQLLKLQNADGGWAFLQKADSESLTTGQVLYAMGTLGRNRSDPNIARAWSYLLRTQQADGSWNVPWLAFNLENKKDHTDGNKVFSYWGTTWSVLGLLHTLPK